jgi:hypothetical protein
MGATQTIPIVMAPAGAPLQSGFIDSLARSWGKRLPRTTPPVAHGRRPVASQVARELMWSASSPTRTPSSAWSAQSSSSRTMGGPACSLHDAGNHRPIER